MNLENKKFESNTETEISEIKNLAFHNKKNAMFKKFRIIIDDIEYNFIIKGIGQKTVKLELFIDYKTLLKNKDSGIIESRLYDIISAIYDKGKSVEVST